MIVSCYELSKGVTNVDVFFSKYKVWCNHVIDTLEHYIGSDERVRIDPVTCIVSAYIVSKCDLDMSWRKILETIQDCEHHTLSSQLAHGYLLDILKVYETHLKDTCREYFQKCITNGDTFVEETLMHRITPNTTFDNEFWNVVHQRHIFSKFKDLTRILSSFKAAEMHLSRTAAQQMNHTESLANWPSPSTAKTILSQHAINLKHMIVCQSTFLANSNLKKTCKTLLNETIKLNDDGVDKITFMTNFEKDFTSFIQILETQYHANDVSIEWKQDIEDKVEHANRSVLINELMEDVRTSRCKNHSVSFIVKPEETQIVYNELNLIAINVNLSMIQSMSTFFTKLQQLLRQLHAPTEALHSGDKLLRDEIQTWIKLNQSVYNDLKTKYQTQFQACQSEQLQLSQSNGNNVDQIMTNWFVKAGKLDYAYALFCFKKDCLKQLKSFGLISDIRQRWRTQFISWLQLSKCESLCTQENQLMDRIWQIRNEFTQERQLKFNELQQDFDQINQMIASAKHLHLNNSTQNGSESKTKFLLHNINDQSVALLDAIRGDRLTLVESLYTHCPISVKNATTKLSLSQMHSTTQADQHGTLLDLFNALSYHLYHMVQSTF